MEENKFVGTIGARRDYDSKPEDFMNLLEGDNTPKGQENWPSWPTDVIKDANRTVINDDNSMKKILERFHSVSEQSVSLMEKSEIKRLASRKVSTDREWKVVINEAEAETMYNIVNTKANKSYFKNIKTLEAANLIIDHLERKEPINSTKIFKVLDLDETFRRNRIDAIQFKNKWKKLVEKKRYANADIYEARYQKSKQLAIEAKRELKRM